MSKSAVNHGFTPDRTRDIAEYEAMVRRVIKAHGRRVAASDPEDLGGLLALHEVIEQAIAVAIEGQRETGFSWAEIGRGLGTTKQNAYQRFGKAGKP
jgi:hypothetical protein